MNCELRNEILRVTSLARGWVGAHSLLWQTYCRARLANDVA